MITVITHPSQSIGDETFAVCTQKANLLEMCFFCGFKRNLHQWIGTLHRSLDKSAILLGTLVSMPQRLSINPVEQKIKSRMGYYLKVKGRQFLLNTWG